MGCELSKLAGNPKSDGGNVLGPSEPPPPAAPDPRLPLTARQKYTMMASWKGISRATQTTGVHMFIELFEEHADLLGMFSKFKELKTKEQQATSEELAEHANKVMETLDEGIRGLDDLDTFFEYLHQIGASHRKIQGFKREYFWRIERPFLSAVENTLGDRYTANVEGIYKLTIKFIIETLIAGYDNSASSNQINSANNHQNPSSASGTNNNNGNMTEQQQKQ
ncbi:neuroglobin-like [Condylostylus longicornis]|uniref:neuroglobin-like n=1 Tax=Condylostylus longicornis TaxID=2530218 RepID=UPI00244E39EF|nr:neuroglobin-like [Condylostylus longicornis]XP_055390300.1 neuroglobin-like [Condylostylus longicornis]XP_055390301.1 neuroglobin-like [Condylostylus longicornis]XP_055390302.1 neuroglobin-like [Condylostylus longicornis]XP_055390303.1 neuroglobin-like [Condylostylus longicornis]XP_055390304.1 neuroglobin-like [Condylostylus longicornis]XP_055390305.1 neuroglobin-like [Condylostylus longicornis]XP_055390306.1 neuroglobin-like [Condylostylus longicornis]XP_055390307.1 neuroglobin-like [Co